MAGTIKSILFAVLLLGSNTSSAQAEREVHVITVGKGLTSDTSFGTPIARVVIDRPDQEVGLVLIDSGDLLWRLDATEGTIVTEIIRSGPSHRDSEITLSGVPVHGAFVPELPLVFRPLGRDFRSLLDRVSDLTGTTQIQSFQSAHQARSTPIRVDRVDRLTRGLAQNYLDDELGDTSDLPEGLLKRITDHDTVDQSSVEFDQTGVTITTSNGTSHFAVSSNVPDILLPVAAIYDVKTGIIYAVTYGAEGYVYSINTQTGHWALVTSLNGYDAASLFYQSDLGKLILTGAFSRPGDIRIIGLNGDLRSVFLPVTAFPGLSDLFDFGNEDAPSLVPLGLVDDWLLLKAQDDTSKSTRTYAVQVETKEVRLLRYSND